MIVAPAPVAADKGAIRSHYDLATPFYRLVWGPHIHHGLWPEGGLSAAAPTLSPRDAQDALTDTLAAAGDVRPVAQLDFAFVLGGDGDADAAGASNGANVDAFAQATILVRRLVVDHADDVANLTWAGQSYEQTPDASPTGAEVVERVPVSQGLTIRSSEAVLVSFEV